MEYLFLVKSALVLANLPCPPALLFSGTLQDLTPRQFIFPIVSSCHQPCIAQAFLEAEDFRM